MDMHGVNQTKVDGRKKTLCGTHREDGTQGAINSHRRETRGSDSGRCTLGSHRSSKKMWMVT